MHEETRYGIRTRLDIPYEEAVEAVTGALKDAGFGVLTEIDVKSTLKKKLDADFRRYIILGACNPPLAHEALSTELEIGLLLPCNVIVYEEGESSVVSVADPRAMVAMTGSEELESVAAEARRLLTGVVDALAG
jgi:uncharacterized protein (DUF302 family)